MKLEIFPFTWGVIPFSMTCVHVHTRLSSLVFVCIVGFLVAPVFEDVGLPGDPLSAINFPSADRTRGQDSRMHFFDNLIMYYYSTYSPSH